MRTAWARIAEIIQMKNRQNLRNGQVLTVALILGLGISLTTQAQNQANPVKNVQAQDSVITTGSAISGNWC